MVYIIMQNIAVPHCPSQKRHFLQNWSEIMASKKYYV